MVGWLEQGQNNVEEETDMIKQSKPFCRLAAFAVWLVCLAPAVELNAKEVTLTDAAEAV